ncbi:MAG: DUF1080 domain-containing protein [Planctomycetota bacterium]
MLAWSLAVSLSVLAVYPPQDKWIHRFERQTLDTRFFCEGATYGDIDGDGENDIIAGPFWFQGPSFETRHEIYEPAPFDKEGYSDNFLVWTDDFDSDGWLDVLVGGFPGKAARLYRNPGDPHAAGHWAMHEVFAVVDNESPAYEDLTGDGRKELVFHTGGRFGWAGPDPSDPFAPWVFHPLSDDRGITRFTHGLGVGDVDGDGRRDLLERSGWWRQPPSLEGDPLWTFHPVSFGDGGAQMFTEDFDGDGDADVLTSIQAHGYGLAWFEQTIEGDEIAFTPHRILGTKPEDNPYGVCFTQMHAIDLADIDGDGRRDIITGKRHWAHQGHDPEGTLPPVSYWFRNVRRGSEVELLPYRIDIGTGVGTQLVTGDVDGDGLRDLVVGNKKGIFFLRHLSERVAPAVWQATQPQRITPLPKTTQSNDEVPRGDDGAPLNLGFEDGTLKDWTATGNAFEGQPIEGDTVHPRRSDMASDHAGTYWIGGFERFGDARTGTLTSEPFRVTHPWATFLVNGGSWDETRVDVLLKTEDGEERIFTTSGRSSETLRRATVDLRPYQGRQIFVRIIDQHQGGWGHINFDDFLFHVQKPDLPGPNQKGGRLPDPPPPLDEVVHAGLSPKEAAQAMTVPDGFEVTLFAGEPDVHQPIAFTFDDRGRMWVAEAYSYPVRRPEGEAEDKIVIFEDEDGDGTFDSRKVFQDGLNLVSGLEVGFGGVWVGAAPHLLFIPDRNGDDRPDGEPEILLDGWGYQDTHETLNTFTWGPDGWLYGCHGVFTHSRVGKPGTPDEDRVPINAGIFRYHPTRHVFEVFAHGTSNPWGIDFDDTGQCFVEACVIPHLFHIIQGGRYHRQAGRHFNPATYADIQTCADHVHWAGDRGPHAGNQRSASVGGGHAHAGAMFYLADQWPAEWHGKLLIHNIHGDRTNVERLERQGSGFVGRHEPDFLISHDEWSQMINLRVGPLGSVWMIDWYDQQVCHTNRVEAHDRTNGRIYRVSYGVPEGRPVDVAALDPIDLVDKLQDPNDWWARHARRRLQELGPDPGTHRRLLHVVRTHPDERRALRALWALHATEGLTETIGLEMLGHPGEWVRAWTIQLLCERKKPSDKVLAKLSMLARRDPSAVVRLYLASALQRLPLTARPNILAGLLQRASDVTDANLPLMIWYGLEPLIEDHTDQAWQLVSGSPFHQVVEFTARRMMELGKASGAGSLFEDLAEGGPRATWILQGLQRAVEGQRGLPMPKGWAAAADGLEASESQEVRQLVQSLAATFGDPRAFSELRSRLVDRSRSTADRQAALTSLAEARDPELPPLLLELIVSPEDAALHRSALNALARYDEARIPRSILGAYSGLSASDRRVALGVLTARSTWAGELLRAIGREEIASSDLGADVVRRLRNLDDEEVTRLVGEVWGVMRNSPAEKQAEIERVRRLLSAKAPEPDPKAGRALFARSCQSCHTLFDRGEKIGPDLTGSNRADMEYLLENVLDPSAVVGKDYLSTLIITEDERYVTGLVIDENARRVTLRTADEEIIIPTSDIGERSLLETSMMPDGLLAGLSDLQIRDLFAYLGSPSQVPLRAGPLEAAELFNGHDLTGWHGADVWSVEDSEIVGLTTEGLGRNEFLKSELWLSDFRLTLEVKLVENRGNSGVQFRSHEIADGDVAGYQADIGAGWWGKLYEEHGRALLWDESGEAAVKSGQWNLYVIEARGDHLRTWLNGSPCVDLVDPEGAREGIIALQLHSGGPTEIRFRNLKLELLDASESGGERQ